jgi:hypothetical protein
MAKQNQILVAGDLLAMAIVTVIGFATHNEADISFLPRMAIVFLPLTVAWFLLAPWLRLFQQEITSNPRQLWRPVFVMIFAGALAVVVRGLILGTAIIPIFAVVLCATSALGMFIWRGAYILFTRNGAGRPRPYTPH